MNGQCARRVDACRREDHPFCLHVDLEDVNALEAVVVNADDVSEGVVGTGDGRGGIGDLGAGLCDDGRLIEDADDGSVAVGAAVPFTGADFVRAAPPPPHLELEVVVPKGEREAQD